MWAKGLLLLLTVTAATCVEKLDCSLSGTAKKHEGIFKPTDIPKGKKEFLGSSKMSVHVAVIGAFVGPSEAISI